MDRNVGPQHIRKVRSSLAAVTDPMSLPVTVDVVASLVTTWKLATTAASPLIKKGTAALHSKSSSRMTKPDGLMS
jgi:hypothetical protein